MARKSTRVKQTEGDDPPIGPPTRAKITRTTKPRTKGEIYQLLAEHAGVSRKQVVAMFDALGEVIAVDLSKSGPGVVNVGGIMKVTVRSKPAVGERKGIDPFTKEERVFKAVPERRVVKIRALRALKDML